MLSESELNLGPVLNVDFRSSRESSRFSYAQWSLLGPELSDIEVLEDQDLCVKLVERTLVSKNEFNLKNYESALRHQYIIARFGRFPHRNKILGRISTKEEIEFLKEPNSSF